MQTVTPRVYTDTTQRGCNPSFVVTSDGVVVIDTPQLPTKAVAMRREAEAHGPIRYVINTEHHVDHIFGNYYFRGAGPVIAHVEVARNFMLATQHPSPYAYAREALPTDDPAGVAIFPDEETYFQDPNRPAITFTQDLTLKVGGHTFELLFTPGHTVGQIAVHVPEERVVFTGDTIFCECQTWLYVSNVDQWLAALDRIRALDVDHVVPGHGPGDHQGLRRRAAGLPAGVGHGGGRRRRPGVEQGGVHRSHLLRRPLPGGHRPGVHDGPHPAGERGRPVRQADRRAPGSSGHAGRRPSDDAARVAVPAGGRSGSLARHAPNDTA